MTLTRRLLLLAFIAILPAIAIWTYTEVALRRAREAEVHDLALRQAQLASFELERILDGVRNLLVAVGEVADVRALNAPACAAYLAALQPKVPHLLSITALDPAGRARCRHDDPGTDLRFDDRSYFQEAVASGGFVIGEYTDDRVLQLPVLPVALPIVDAGGQKLGVLAAVLDLKWLGSRIAERALPAGGSLTVADRLGRIIAREPFPERFVGTTIPDDFKQQMRGSEPGTREIVSQDGTKRVLGYIPLSLPPRDLYVSAGLSSKAAYATINDAAKRGFVLIACSFGLALALAWLAGRSFVTRPFRVMTEAVGAWRRGDYGVRIDLPRGGGEMKDLADAFNDLMDDVTERQAALRDSEERVRLALDAGRMGAWWRDPRTGEGGWSPQAAALLGLNPLQTTGHIAAWRQAVHPDDVAKIEALMSNALAGGEEYDAEYRVYPEGKERWLATTARLLRDEAGQPVQFIGILRDVTARKQADEHTQMLIDELNHRVKNTLATVQSIAVQTLRTDPDPVRFREAFESRLLALSNTHNLLTRNAWRDAELRAILDSELAPYRRLGDQAVVLQGPDLRLPARIAINLGLVLHELTTNAAKYGALSNAQGQLAVTWSLEKHPQGGETLSLTWRETGGPAVLPPTRRGFGTRLIERSIEGELAGIVALRYPASGVHCEITIPLAGNATARPPLALAG
ncbi:MAG TPA: HWE histidine kinase domain-containing protein [Microvirga sp.]|jgi:PAS domain S-box-containing protein|nr:HWE histidine kinase domain-containing protein [Microvirga sp.]